ncbi:MAG TPA: type II toxin-antitoxin system mRNA interferase toxin, RelE/StbE family [Lentisphaeria bacterium]|nr:type II toxin-antitoxin system mRNA interferase toxin, RelE/StbE family [Lentisphaeria bacterium]
MTYSLKFHPDALKEWNRLPAADKNFFKTKLKQRLEDPHILGSRLSGGHNRYKIKRMRPPLRLTYHVDDQDLVVTALSVGKRDGDVCREMIKRYGR